MSLRRGQVYGDFSKEEIKLEELVKMMAGGAELENLAHELESAAEEDPAAAELKKAAQVLEREIVDRPSE